MAGCFACRAGDLSCITYEEHCYDHNAVVTVLLFIWE
jgi:hypothetical protein